MYNSLLIVDKALYEIKLVNSPSVTIANHITKAHKWNPLAFSSKKTIHVIEASRAYLYLKETKLFFNLYDIKFEKEFIIFKAAILKRDSENEFNIEFKRIINNRIKNVSN